VNGKVVNMSADRNKEIALRYFTEVVGKANLDLIDELVHPQGQDRAGEWPPGPEGFREHIDWFHSAFDLSIEVDRVIADEEHAVVYWRVQGLHVGPAFGVKATGKQIKNSAISTIIFRDGLIFEYEVLFDLLRFLIQVESLGSWASNFSE
jgi:predicted ester cyclase